jgi:hypothetical protein
VSMSFKSLVNSDRRTRPYSSVLARRIRFALNEVHNLSAETGTLSRAPLQRSKIHGSSDDTSTYTEDGCSVPDVRIVDEMKTAPHSCS